KSGSSELKPGTDELKSGSSELKAGTDELKSGSSELKAGTDELKSGSSELSQGANDAKSGISELKSVLEQQLSPCRIELAAGVEKAQSSVNDPLIQMEDLRDALEVVKDNQPELDDDFVFIALMEQLKAGLEESDVKIAKFQELADGSNEIKDGLA